MAGKFKPGRGWSHAGGAVFDHVDGIRIHVSGMCRLPPDGEVVKGTDLPEIQMMNWFIRINGGNRKRGVMAWARNLAWRGCLCFTSSNTDSTTT